MKNKYILSTIFGIILALGLYGQAPGYQGKHLFLAGGGSMNFAWGEGGRTGPRFGYKAQLGIAFTRKWSLLGEFEFMPRKFVAYSENLVGVNTYECLMGANAFSIGLLFEKSKILSPYGGYYRMGLKYYRTQAYFISELDEEPNPNNNVDLGDTHFMRIIVVFDFGYRAIIADRITIDWGFRAGFPLYGTVGDGHQSAIKRQVAMTWAMYLPQLYVTIGALIL